MGPNVYNDFSLHVNYFWYEVVLLSFFIFLSLTVTSYTFPANPQNNQWA